MKANRAATRDCRFGSELKSFDVCVQGCGDVCTDHGGAMIGVWPSPRQTVTLTVARRVDRFQPLYTASDGTVGGWRGDTTRKEWASHLFDGSLSSPPNASEWFEYARGARCLHSSRGQISVIAPWPTSGLRWQSGDHIADITGRLLSHCRQHTGDKHSAR